MVQTKMWPKNVNFFATLVICSPSLASALNSVLILSIYLLKGRFFCKYVIQHCFICRPSNSTVSEEAGIKPRIVAALTLTAKRSNHWLDPIHSRLDLIHTRLDRIHTWLDLIHTRLDLIHTCFQVLESPALVWPDGPGKVPPVCYWLQQGSTSGK